MKEKLSTGLIILIVSLCVASLFLGVTIGTVGTIHLVANAAIGMFEVSDTTVNFDLNETKLVNEMYLINEANKDTEEIVLLS